jgi:hypothetical protein
MKSIFYPTLMLLSFALVAGGCGNSYKTPLTQEQKDQVHNSLSSMSRTVSAVESRSDTTKKNLVGGENAHVAFTALRGFMSTSKAEKPTVKPTSKKEIKKDTKKEEMEEEFKSSDDACEVSFENKTKAASANSVNMLITAKGESCPATMDFSITAKGTEKDADIAFAWKYEVKKDSYRKLNDIDKVDISGKVNVEMDTSPTSKGDASFSLDLSGTVHSQEHGDLKFEFEGDAEQSFNKSTSKQSKKGEIALRLDYEKFGAELKVVAEEKDKKDVVTYFINNEETTEEDFMSYVDSLPGFASAGLGAAGVSTPTTDVEIPSSSDSL